MALYFDLSSWISTSFLEIDNPRPCRHIPAHTYIRLSKAVKDRIEFIFRNSYSGIHHTKPNFPQNCPDHRTFYRHWFHYFRLNLVGFHKVDNDLRHVHRSPNNTFIQFFDFIIQRQRFFCRGIGRNPVWKGSVFSFWTELFSSSSFPASILLKSRISLMITNRFLELLSSLRDIDFGFGVRSIFQQKDYSIPSIVFIGWLDLMAQC